MGIKTTMTLMIITPEADRIHMALMVAATSAAMGQKTNLFFSKGALTAITEGGWQTMQCSHGIKANEMDSAQIDKGIGDYSVLIDGLAAMDVRFMACETGLREMNLTHSDLITRVPIDITGLATLIEQGRGGDWLTF